MHPVSPEGELDESVRAEPIAADFRTQPGGHQGWTTPAAYREALEAQGTMKVKAVREAVDAYVKQQELGGHRILAGVLGVPMRTLTQKDKSYQLEKARRRTRQLAAWLSATALLTVLAISATLVAWSQKQLAHSNERRAISRKRKRTSRPELLKNNENLREKTNCSPGPTKSLPWNEKPRLNLRQRSLKAKHTSLRRNLTVLRDCFTRAKSAQRNESGKLATSLKHGDF